MFIRTDLQSPIILYSFFLSSVVLLSFQASVCVPALVSVWVVRAVFNIGDEDENSSFFFKMATGGVNQYYHPVDPLVLDGPAHLISERWRKWKISFLFFFSAQDVTGPDRKHSFLLHFAGGEAVRANKYNQAGLKPGHSDITPRQPRPHVLEAGEKKMAEKEEGGKQGRVERHINWTACLARQIMQVQKQRLITT